MSSFSLHGSAKLDISDKEFAARLRKKAAPIIARKLQDARLLVLKQARQYIIDQIKDSDVLSRLCGSAAGDKSGRDLQAEFGLFDDFASHAVDQLVDAISATDLLTLDKSPSSLDLNSRSVILSYEVKGMDPQLYVARMKSIPLASYISDDSGIEIPWVRILLEKNGNLIENVGVWGINYAPWKGSESRSGRATMTNKEHMASRFPWVIPPGALQEGSGRGSNFVENIILSQEFKDGFIDVIEKAIKRYINK